MLAGVSALVFIGSLFAGMAIYAPPDFRANLDVLLAMATRSFEGVYFWFPEKIVVRCSYFVLAFHGRINIVVGVPYRYGARSGGLRGVERGAEVREL